MTQQGEVTATAKADDDGSTSASSESDDEDFVNITNLRENFSLESLEGEMHKTAIGPKRFTISECNPCLPDASSALKLAFNVDKGRCLIAARNILPGTLYIIKEIKNNVLEYIYKLFITVQNTLYYVQYVRIQHFIHYRQTSLGWWRCNLQSCDFTVPHAQIQVRKETLNDHGKQDFQHLSPALSFLQQCFKVTKIMIAMGLKMFHNMSEDYFIFGSYELY